MIKGIIGKKIGMTQIFREDGEAVPVTVIQAGPCWVTQIKTDETDDYTAVQLGFEEVGADADDDNHKQYTIERRISKPERGHLGLLSEGGRALSVPALRHLREFRVADTSEVEEGQKITVDVFTPGEFVDVIGTSKGKGFAGTIKRHNFRRQPKTHGQSDRERAPGSIGATSTPGRVKPGMRMAGRMGNARVTVQNLEVVAVDQDRNLLAVKGSIPGAKGGLVTVEPTVKRK